VIVAEIVNFVGIVEVGSQFKRTQLPVTVLSNKNGMRSQISMCEGTIGVKKFQRFQDALESCGQV
jgi:hypothetical protein